MSLIVMLDQPKKLLRHQSILPLFQFKLEAWTQRKQAELIGYRRESRLLERMQAHWVVRVSQGKSKKRKQGMRAHTEQEINLFNRESGTLAAVFLTINSNYLPGSQPKCDKDLKRAICNWLSPEPASWWLMFPRELKAPSFGQGYHTTRII